VSEPDKAGTGARERCALCGKPATIEYRPFCSKRCADRDLHRWLSGRYAIPGEEVQSGAAESDPLEDSEGGESAAN
jgi:endogenous inhibitor of DNA gyrase (YacG/DUF329 family)